MLDHTLIEEYCDTLARNGVDSPQAQAVRDSNAGNPEFVTFADSIDKVKKTLASRRERTSVYESLPGVTQPALGPESIPGTARTGVATTG